MLVVENNTHSYNWGMYGEVRPLKYSGDLVIVFDPSKTNMAVVIGTPSGNILSLVEFSGNNRSRGPVMDTTQYCLEVREFLYRYIGHCNIYLAATEATIEKKGSSYYQSNLVLTEIRANILNFFTEKFGIKCLEVNNWSWKHKILPDGYRSQKEKGSVRFFHDYYPEAGIHNFYKADMTDAMCIFMYCIETMCKNYTLMCNSPEPCSYLYNYSIVPTSGVPDSERMSVIFNERFSLVENLNYYSNRIAAEFEMEVPVVRLSIDDVYGHAKQFTRVMREGENVKVVARRC